MFELKDPPATSNQVVFWYVNLPEGWMREWANNEVLGHYSHERKEHILRFHEWLMSTSCLYAYPSH